MNTITVNGDTFEIVDFFPLGYSIWNIGKNMPDGYLPLCRLSQRQPFPGGRNIETDTLKAIKIDGAQTVLAAVDRGCNTPRVTGAIRWSGYAPFPDEQSSAQHETE